MYEWDAEFMLSRKHSGKKTVLSVTMNPGSGLQRGCRPQAFWAPTMQDWAFK